MTATVIGAAQLRNQSGKVSSDSFARISFRRPKQIGHHACICRHGWLRATASRRFGGIIMRAIHVERDRGGLATLLAEVAAGDKSAFTKLYGRTSRKLFGVALRVLRDRHAAEDILQEVYVRIWRNASSFDRELASPIAWMASIARHCAIDTLRKQKLKTVELGDESAHIAANEPDPGDELDLAQRRAIAFAAIKKMDPRKRELFLRAYFHQLSRDSLAKAYGLPTGTIKTHLRRSLLELQQAMPGNEEREHTRRAVEAA